MTINVCIVCVGVVDFVVNFLLLKLIEPSMIHVCEKDLVIAGYTKFQLNFLNSIRGVTSERYIYDN